VPVPGIASVWERIETHAGQEFHLIRGATFQYAVVAGHVVPDRTPQQIPKSHFEKALDLVPLASTAVVQNLRGPSFIYAILMDDRIRQTDW
jgi:hypothetical protein